MNFYPDTNFLKDGKHYEGYWFSSDSSNQNYPKPESNELWSQSEIMQDFIKKLECVQEASLKSSRKLREVMPSFCLKRSLTRKRNFDFTKFELNEAEYLGYSTCRFCKESNGSNEYELIIKDDQSNDLEFWIWPQGLIHYYQKHQVIPSQKFYDMIMNLPTPKLIPDEEKELTPELIELYKKMDQIAQMKNIMGMMSGCAGLRFTT